MKIEFSFFAEFANRSEYGALNVLGILTAFVNPTLPFADRKFLVIRIRLESGHPGSINELVHLTLLDPDNQQIGTGVPLCIDSSAYIPVEMDIFDLALPLPPMVFTKYGRHRLQIRKGPQLLYAAEFEVARSRFPKRETPPPGATG